MLHFSFALRNKKGKVGDWFCFLRDFFPIIVRQNDGVVYVYDGVVVNVCVRVPVIITGLRTEGIG